MAGHGNSLRKPGQRAAGAATPGKALGTATPKTASLDDDEFSDVADILRKHGIR